jgi:hypothetical protein
MSLLSLYEESNHVLYPDSYTETISIEGSALLDEVTPFSYEIPPHTQLAPIPPPNTYLPFSE